MADANEEYFNASLRHAIDVRRFQIGTVKKLLPILEQADKELTSQLRGMLEELGVPVSRMSYSAQRLKALLDDVRAARAEAFRRIQEDLTSDLTDFARLEAKVEEEILAASVPVTLSLASVSLRTIASVIEKNPFNGAILGQWFKTLALADQQRLNQAITLGIANGETIDQIIRRVVGTKANNYQDGALSVSRRNAEAIVRTAVNHVSNSTRQEVWNENQDIISGERWVSTLDGRTSAVCRARDGTIYDVGVGPRPPAHWNCRSVMVAVLNGVGVIGDRPFVVDDRRNNVRQVDFRAEAKARGVSVQQVRAEWAQKNVGQTPAATTYQEWLSKQSAAFQDKVLGDKKGKLFRDGGLKLDQFVDRVGTELTLKQLKKNYPGAWQKALGGD